MTRQDETRRARTKLSRSAVVAVMAGGNLIGAPAIFAIWYLHKRGFILGPPFWAYALVIVSSVGVDLIGRAWLLRRPTSRVRMQVRVAIGAVVTTAVLYASGWGSVLAIAFAILSVQMLAQNHGIDWRAVFAWSGAGALVGEIAIQTGLAPHVLGVSQSHAIAAAGIGLLGGVLWVVSSTFAERDHNEQELRDREQRLEHEAATDSLTQLLNRGAFTAALERSCAANEPAILAFVDLDNFKDINDSFGHHMGDHVLVEVAARLRRVVREEDLIARFGGDEFVILVKSSSDDADAGRLVERIWTVLAEPWPIIAPNAVSASVGVVDDRDGSRSPEDLLREADKAMYARKHGMRATGSMAAMTSRTLAHHRLAMDGMHGSFVVLRAIREAGAIVDYEVLEANSIMRATFAGICDEVVGARMSTLNQFADNVRLNALYAEALSTGRHVNMKGRVNLADGRKGWSDVNVVTVDRDVIAVVANDITREVEAHLALETERKRFASLVTGSSDLACVLDASGAIVYAPAWGMTFLGYPSEEMRPPLSLVAPADRESAAAWFDEVLALPPGADAVSVALRFVARDLSVHTCDVTAQNRMQESSIGGIVINAHDVSALVTAEARLVAVADAVSDVIAICDAEGRMMWVSGAARRELDLEPGELVGTSAFDMFHADDRAGIGDRLAAMLDHPDNVTPPLDVRVRRSDGTYRWFEASGSNQLGDPSIRGLVISLRDTTDRRASEAALRMSEERNRSVVETAADAIITVDANGIIQTFNHAAELIFATRAIDAIGQASNRFLPADSLEIRHAGEGGYNGQQIDTIVCRADGERFAAHVAITDAQVGDTHYYTAVVRDISDQRAMEQALRIAASCDELTGLPNRRTLLECAKEAIEEARRTDDVVGMVFVDLDRFKLVNDGLGHDAGDQLLVLVADRIADAIRVQDVVARLGSDEFVVLCPSASDLDAIKTVAHRIVDALGGPFVISGSEVFVGASIGVSVSTGIESPLELLRFADTAMYRAKEDGNSRIEVFDTKMQRHAARRLDVESALRQARGRDELLAYYQPIVDLETGEVSNLEALIRWDRRGVGLIRPDNFIPVAEEAGIIMEIGAWMMHTATRDCMRWQSVAPGVGVSVNVSVRQFEAGDLVDEVQHALTESGLPAALLTLEITESVMLDHNDRNAAIMRRIRDLGMHISLDDFGSGYSSLTYLRLLPIDSIKIDRSFLQSLGTELRDEAMLRAIVNLGTAHDLVVVAEGIDTPAKLEAVRTVGCHHGQGFLFAKPMPLSETLTYLGLDPAMSHRAS
ncbi:MAG TPA: diguanylate cyclase [Acidimicrobiia bacterium]|nr:diguanylate cyclase [Acidimicrobiia bacterium]